VHDGGDEERWKNGIGERRREWNAREARETRSRKGEKEGRKGESEMERS
jgi:hypothetical protein